MRRVRSSRTGPATISDPDGGSLPAKPLPPRCGRVMLRYEAVWGPLLDEVTCGRPEGHPGRCRSVQAITAMRERNRDRWPADRERRKARKLAARLSLPDQLAIAVADAAEEARWDALGR